MHTQGNVQFVVMCPRKEACGCAIYDQGKCGRKPDIGERGSRLVYTVSVDSLTDTENVIRKKITAEVEKGEHTAGLCNNYQEVSGLDPTVNAPPHLVEEVEEITDVHETTWNLFTAVGFA